MSEFVILFHKMPETSSRADHWDLMLEWEGSLVVWALESLPIEGETIRGTRLPDHRWGLFADSRPADRRARNRSPVGQREMSMAREGHSSAGGAVGSP